MSDGIQQHITDIHQRVKDFVEGRYQGYRVFSIRNYSSTFYAEETVSIVEMSVEAAKGDDDLHCLVSVNDDAMSISREQESPYS